MKLQLRAKHGQPVKVLDENGNELEGVIGVELHAAGRDRTPAVRITVRPVAVVFDGEGEIRTLPPAAPAPAATGGADGGEANDKGGRP